MKTLIAFIILFSVTFGSQQAQAQTGKSYSEWLKGKSGGSKATAKKTSAKAKAAGTTAEAAPAPAMAAPNGTFRGTLACADCQGIRVELTLTGAPKDANRSFTMKQMYVGKPESKGVVSSSGKWFLAKGNIQNPEAVVLQLIPTAGDVEPVYFLQVSEREIKLLNRQQDEFKDSRNYSLRKL